MEKGRVTTYRLGEQGGGGRQCPTQCLFSAEGGVVCQFVEEFQTAYIVLITTKTLLKITNNTQNYQSSASKLHAPC